MSEKFDGFPLFEVAILSLVGSVFLLLYDWRLALAFIFLRSASVAEFSWLWKKLNEKAI